MLDSNTWTFTADKNAWHMERGDIYSSGPHTTKQMRLMILATIHHDLKYLSEYLLQDDGFLVAL